MELKGLHHLTAVTGDPSVNVAFYTQVLGLRLVKKTVNQDDTSAYHLFYGDSLGRPGTEVTFFDWPHAGRASRGTGVITATALRVPGQGALEAWAQRLADFGVRHKGIRELGGRTTLEFADPEGQRLRLVDGGQSPGSSPWPASPVPETMVIRGLHAVQLTVRQAAPTVRLLTDILGFREHGRYTSPEGSAVRMFEAGPGGPSTEVHLEERPDLGPGRVGIGGVHHVAFRTPDGAQQEAWRRRLAEAGVRITPGHRPLLLPLHLLPGARRGALRDRHGRARLRHRRGRGSPGGKLGPAPLPGAPPRQHRGRPAADPASEDGAIGPGPAYLTTSTLRISSKPGPTTRTK